MPGDDLDPFEIQGNLSVITASDPLEFGDGSIDVDSNINLNGHIGENLVGNGFLIKDLKKFTIKEQSTPSLPPSLEQSFFLDTSDSLFKSLNTSGTLTTYQPTTIKGDIVVHNGTTQVRLPKNIDGEVLTVDSTTPTGLKWFNLNTSENTLDIRVKTLIGSLNYTEVQNRLYGCYFNKVYNQREKGPAGNFVYCKSRQEIDGFIIRLTSAPGISSFERLRSTWIENEEPEISKLGSNYDGNYSTQLLTTNSPINTINLSGDSFITLLSNTSGNFILNITNDFGGPHCSYFLSKNIVTNGASIVRVANSPGTGTNNIRIRWLPSSPIEIRKVLTSDDGSYGYTDILTELSLNTIETISLSGTTKYTLDLKKYQRVSGIISITSSVSNGPSAIFTFSKNDKTQAFSIIRVVNCPGQTSLERLRLEWLANDRLKVYKTGSNYDGAYDINIII